MSLLQRASDHHGVGIATAALDGILRAHSVKIEAAPHGIFMKMHFPTMHPKANVTLPTSSKPGQEVARPISQDTLLRMKDACPCKSFDIGTPRLTPSGTESAVQLTADHKVSCASESPSANLLASPEKLITTTTASTRSSLSSPCCNSQPSEGEEVQSLDDLARLADPLFDVRVAREYGGKIIHGIVEDIEVGICTGERLYRVKYVDGDLGHFTADDVGMCMVAHRHAV